MENALVFKDFSETYLKDPKQFAVWITSPELQWYAEIDPKIQPIAEELLIRLFHSVIPLKNEVREEFIEKFKNYTMDSDRYSLLLEGMLKAQRVTCAELADLLFSRIKELNKGAEQYAKTKGLLPSNELKLLFSDLGRYMRGHEFLTRLEDITHNVEYLSMKGVIIITDLEKYLQKK